MAAPDYTVILQATRTYLLGALGPGFPLEVSPVLPELNPIDAGCLWISRAEVTPRRIIGLGAGGDDETLTLQVHLLGYSANSPGASYLRACELVKLVRDYIVASPALEGQLVIINQLRTVAFEAIDGQHCQATLVYAAQTES